MSYRELVALVVAAAFVAPTLVMCSSGPAPADDEEGADAVVERPEAVEADDAAGAFEAAAHWLPADSLMVVTAVQPSIWDLAEVVPLFFDDVEDARDGAGTMEGLRADLEEFFRASLGFDPARAEGFAAAHDGEAVVAVVFGDFDVPEGLDQISFGDHIAYELDGVDDVVDPVDAGVILPIEVPAPGLLVAPDVETLEDAIDGDTSLATGDSFETYERLFADAAGQRFVAASTVDEFLPPEAMNGQRPQNFALTLGTSLGLLIEDDPANLQQIDDQIEQMWPEVQSAANELLDGQPFHDGLTDRLGATVALHLGTSVFERLDSDLDGDQLRYELELIDVEDTIYATGLFPSFAAVALLDIVESASDSEPVEVEEVIEAEAP